MALVARGEQGFCESAHRNETLPEYWNSYSSLFIAIHVGLLQFYLWKKHVPHFPMLDTIMWLMLLNCPVSFAYHYTLNVWAGMMDVSTIFCAAWLGAGHVWYVIVRDWTVPRIAIQIAMVAGWQLTWTLHYLPDSPVEMQYLLMIPNGLLILGFVVQGWFFRHVPGMTCISWWHIAGVASGLTAASLWLVTEPSCRSNDRIRDSMWWTHGMVHYLFSLGYCLLLYAQYRIVQAIQEGNAF